MDRPRLLEHRLRNELQQLGLLAVLAVILGYLSWVIGGESFMRGALTGVGVLYLVGQLLLILSIPALILGLATPSSGALLLLLAAPTLSALAQLALSRNREFEADRSAAELSSDPLGLASALDKLELYQGRFWEQMMLPGRSLPEPSLLRTHEVLAAALVSPMIPPWASSPPSCIFWLWVGCRWRRPPVSRPSSRAPVPARRMMTSY